MKERREQVVHHACCPARKHVFSSTWWVGWAWVCVTRDGWKHWNSRACHSSWG